LEGSSITWLALLGAFLIVEAATVALVSVWFAGGSAGALIASLLGGPVWLQITLFAVISAALLLALRPLSKHVLKKQEKPTNVDSIPGTLGRVTEEIDNIASTGRVKLGGLDWKACATGGENIAVGTLVRVDKVEGVKVYVTQEPADK